MGLLRHVQAVLDHPGQQLCDAMVFDKERWTEPLRVILQMSFNPFIRPLSERPNER
jgi:hypothetical protein